jgi:NAD(P)H-dependent FMN reductase
MAKSTSPQTKLNYTKYKAHGIQAANRKRKLMRTLKAQPNNTQVTDALNNIKYRRKTPTTRKWSHSAKRFATLVGQIYRTLDPKFPRVKEWEMFNIATRAQG